MQSPHIEAVFGPGGILAKAFPGYEPREGQVQLATAVDEAMRDGASLIAEAPTGTGKSLAYLVPAIHHVTKGGAVIAGRRPPSRDDFADDFDGDGRDEEKAPEPPRVVIATANIALQEQLAGKDLPLLRKLLPDPFTFALAKGLGNYLCQDRCDDSELEQLVSPLQDEREREQWKVLRAWSETTQTGDLSELPFEVLPSLKPKVTTASDDCTGKACPRFGVCHAQKSKAAVKGARVIVTNYHLLFTHIMLLAEFGRGVLPPFDLLVLDEAHKAAEIARDFFGSKVTLGGIRWAVRLLIQPKGDPGPKGPLPPLNPQLRDLLLTTAEAFFADLADVRASRDYYARLKAFNVEGVEWKPLRDLLLGAKAVYEGAAKTGLLTAMRNEELRRAARRCRLLAVYLEASMTLERDTASDPTERHVYFVEAEAARARGAKPRITLGSKPVHVGPLLEKVLFTPETYGIQTCIATSATLTVAERFDFLAGEIGAKKARQLIAPSPFDFTKQCLLVLPRDLPDPSSKTFPAEAAEWVVRAVEQAGGRTLGLFTSYRGLEAATELCRARFGDRLTILRQGEAPRTQLIARFKADVRSVLLGTESFWAGVDVPGEACSCVVIDRIPFATPEDPIANALDETMGRDFFSKVSIPKAAIQLRQGFGRLIRAASDRGCVVLLDRRIIDKPYGKRFLSSLPVTMRSRSIEDIGRFLGVSQRQRGAVAGALGVSL